MCEFDRSINSLENCDCLRDHGIYIKVTHFSITVFKETEGRLREIGVFCLVSHSKIPGGATIINSADTTKAGSYEVPWIHN